jgi:hypothetical protein
LNLTKTDRLQIIAFIAVYFLVLIFLPLFPFQRNALFADAPTTYETYEVTSNEVAISIYDLELMNLYDGDPTYDAGRSFKTAYQWGHVFTKDELEKHLLDLSSRKPNLPSRVCIERKVWGSLPDKSFGLISTDWFLWQNKASLLLSDSKCN